MMARGNISTVEQVDAGFQLDGSGCGPAAPLTYPVDFEKSVMRYASLFNLTGD